MLHGRIEPHIFGLELKLWRRLLVIYGNDLLRRIKIVGWVLISEVPLLTLLNGVEGLKEVGRMPFTERFGSNVSRRLGT